jgi:hypothetical protein
MVPLCSSLTLHRHILEGILIAHGAGGELWQHIGDHYSEAYAAKIMRDVLRTIAQVC